jgi:hypothetical protein
LQSGIHGFADGSPRRLGRRFYARRVFGVKSRRFEFKLSLIARFGDSFVGKGP